MKKQIQSSLSSRRIFVSVLALLLACNAFARAAGQVTVTASVEKAKFKPGETLTLTITADVADGFHAQSHTPSSPDYIPFVIKPKPVAGVTFGEVKYPPGKNENYPALGVLNVYTDEVTFTIPVTIDKNAAPGPLKLGGKASYQACNDEACFPPESPAFEVTITVVGATTAPAMMSNP